MYNSQEVANRIKSFAKIKNVTVGKMLSECDISKNALSSMQAGGYLPRLENILKISDYLDCSVDYLLGRTDNPDSHKLKTKNYTLPPLELAAYGAEETKGTYTTPTEEIT